MLKRTLTAFALTLALVTGASISAPQMSAQAVDEPVEEDGGPCLIWCVTHNKHHTIAC